MTSPPRGDLHRYRPVLAAAVFLWGLTAATTAPAAARDTAPKPSLDGQRIFLENCAACHGTDGKGRSRSRVGFDLPLPDFSDPDFASREPHYDWTMIALHGGPIRGFSEIMPSFREALSRDEVASAVAHMKTISHSKNWPPGEFNLPRPLVTGKAFPEDELVLQSTFSEDPDGLNSIGGKLAYEQRIGPRNMWEISVPFGWSERFVDPLAPTPSWSAGLGDIALAVKRDLAHNLKKGYILSGSAELFLPTGDRASGLGKGTFVLEPFLAYGQLLPADFFLQAQTGLEIPFKREEAQNEAFFRLAVGKEVRFKPWGRVFSPMVELLAAKELVAGEKVLFDAVPQIQVTLSRRLHVRFNVGVRLPLNETAGRDLAIMAYILWDWFDGAFFTGW